MVSVRKGTSSDLSNSEIILGFGKIYFRIIYLPCVLALAYIFLGIQISLGLLQNWSHISLY
jgi:hypothetical protein